MNHALGELCQDLDVEFLKYALEEHHFGVDGLHVRPAGAKHLLFTILGKVKRKCFAPAWIAPCTRKTDITADLDDWPALPSSSLAAKRTVSVVPTWGPVGVRPEKKKMDPVHMPYPRMNCGVSFGWDNGVEPVIMPYPRTICGVSFGWDKIDNPEAKCSSMANSSVTETVALLDQWKKPDISRKMYTERELQSNGDEAMCLGKHEGVLIGTCDTGMMKLNVFGVEAYVKPSGFGIKAGLLGGARNAKQPSTNPGKTKRVSLNPAKEYLKRVCTTNNERNLKPDGPYGDVCGLLSGFSNSKKNRKRLQTLWFRLKKCSSDEDVKMHVRTTQKMTSSSYKSEGKSTVKVSRKRVLQDKYDVLMKDVDYVAIGRVLKDKVNSENFSCLGDLGPYGMTCNILGWENSTSNKLFLFTVWKENRGNVRDVIDDFDFPITKKRRKVTMKNESRVSNFEKNKQSTDTDGIHIKSERNGKNVTNEVNENKEIGENIELSERKEKTGNIDMNGNTEMYENKEIIEKAETSNKISDKIIESNDDIEVCECREISECNETENSQMQCTQNFDPPQKSGFGLKENYTNNHCIFNEQTIQNTEINPSIHEQHVDFTTMEMDQSIDSDDSDSTTIPYTDNPYSSPEKSEETLKNLEQPFLQDNHIISNIDTKTNEQSCISKNYPKHEFEEQYCAKKLLEKDTTEILQMLEKFFSDNESLQNSTFIKLCATYRNVKIQIVRCKKLNERNIDVEKEYKICKEMLMQNLLNLDSLYYTSELQLIKKCRVYINNCALSRLDRLYKKILNKTGKAEKQDYDKISKSSFNGSYMQDTPKNSRDMSNDQQSYDSDDGPLSKQTISSILEIEIPDKYFTKEISQIASFKISENDMNKLLLDRNECAFKRDSWESLFLGKVKESNPYCCFQVINSRLSNATKRKRKAGSPFFLAHAKCTFSDCSIKLTLKMNDKSSVNVTYTGELKHDIKEIRYRPIKGYDRSQLKSQFKGGLKPMAHYLDRLQQFPTEYLVSGNRDGLGKNSRVFAQIAAESRQGGRMDDSTFQSLQELKEEMNKKLEGGFIQKICASPCYIIYWSKYGIDLYNERAKKDALYWDATGSVVRRQEDGKQFLYYELAIRNPIRGKMGIPLTAMITNDQSLSTVLDWLRCFRQAEKQKFGHNSKKIVTFPKLIISDQAMVFILAALKEFNGETLDDFLCRAWNIALGKAEIDDTKKTIVHLCASHFMHTAKLHLKKKDIAGHKLKTFLYMVGLLMNCNSIQDAQELLFDIHMTLGSSTINNQNQKFYDRLMRKINDFNSIADNKIVQAIDEIEEESESVNPSRFTEEEFQILGSTSPFKDWNNSIISKAQKLIYDTSEKNKTDLFINPLHSPSFFDYLNKRLMPMYPLWGSILMGDLSRYHEDYYLQKNAENNYLFNSINNVGKTNSTIENRFRILKDICLGGRTQHRLDEFSERLKTSTIAIQKLVALDCLKYPSFIKSPYKRQCKVANKKNLTSLSKKNKKQKTLVEEQWNKARSQPDNLKMKLGKYQQAPAQEIKLKQTPIKRKCSVDMNDNDNFSPIKTRRLHANVNTNNTLEIKSLKTDKDDQLICSQFCGLTNFGNSCWLNSVLQALAHCQMSTTVLESKDLTIDLTRTEPSNSEIAIHEIIQVWKYMKNMKNFGSQVPDNILRSAFRSVVAAIPGFSIRQQQDAHEFNSNIIADMANGIIDNNLEFHFKEECSQCKKTKTRETNVGQSIVLEIDGIDNVSIQTLVNNFFYGESSVKKCSSCNNETEQTIKEKTITTFPKTLMILIPRYKLQAFGKRNVVSKLHNKIHVSSQFCLTDQNDFQIHYQLKSTVCHHGNSTSSGHYDAVIKYNDKYICCNDKKISLVDSDYTLSTAYLIIYDRVDPSLPFYVQPFLNCWGKTRGVKEVLKVMKFNRLIKGKTNLIEEIQKSGMTESVANEIRKNMSLDLAMNKISVIEFYTRFIKYLTETDEGSETLFKDNFSISTNHIRLCNKCGLVDIQSQNQLTVAVKEFSLNALHNCLAVLSGERVLRMCRCGSKSDIFLMSLPATLVVFVECSNNLVFEDITTLSILNEMREAYPIGSRKYHLKNIFGQKDGNFLTGKTKKIVIYSSAQWKGVNKL